MAEHRRGCNTTDGNASKVRWCHEADEWTKGLKQKKQPESGCAEWRWEVGTCSNRSSEECRGERRGRSGHEELWRTLLGWRAGKNSSCSASPLTRLKTNNIQQHLCLSWKAQVGSWHDSDVLNVRTVALLIHNQQETCVRSLEAFVDLETLIGCCRRHLSSFPTRWLADRCMILNHVCVGGSTDTLLSACICSAPSGLCQCFSFLVPTTSKLICTYSNVFIKHGKVAILWIVVAFSFCALFKVELFCGWTKTNVYDCTASVHFYSCISGHYLLLPVKE